MRSSSDSGDTLRRAIDDHKNGRLEAALQAYNRLVASGSRNPQACRYLASLLGQINRLDQAIGVLRKGIEYLSQGDRSSTAAASADATHEGLLFSDRGIFTELANLLAAQGSGQEAMCLARRAITENPADTQAYELLISLLSQHEQLDECLKLYWGAPAKVRSSFFVCEILASALTVANRLEEAITYRNNGLGLSGEALNGIDEHVRLGITTSRIVAHAGARPHPESNPVARDTPRDSDPSYFLIQNATVLGGEWLLLTDNDTLFLDLNHGTPTGYPSYYQDNISPRESKTARLFLPKPDRAIFDQAILVGGDTNYFHWTVDFFPLLLALGKTPEFQDLPILMHDRLTPFQREGLALAGISEARVQHLRYPGCYRCHELVVPLFPPEQGEPPGRHFRAKALAWARSLAPPLCGRGRRLYISRQGASRRRVVNEKVLIRALKKEGFEILSLDGVSLREQVEIFSQASVVVGAHGAGWGNVAYTPDCCRLIEVATPTWDRPYFENLARIRDQQYTKVMAVPYLTEYMPSIFFDIYITDQAIAQVINAVRDA